MTKKQLKSGLILSGIAPNILLQHIDNTAPFLFKGEIETEGPRRAYLNKLVFYKKNLHLLKNINLTEYFYICMSAHWATAGTFVPTDVDNQIREGLWRHGEIGKHIEKMARITIESWNWDYTQVTNRKSFNENKNQVLSTHEGTWLSVAIGAYCALNLHNKKTLADEMAFVILEEIKKEENLLIELWDKKDYINYMRSCPLVAHNFGDLDRVIDQWKMNDNDLFKKRIYKLGHKLHENYSPLLFQSGLVNKEFLSVENHRHMSLRQPKCLRKSSRFLVPVGPFMDQCGESIGSAADLTIGNKAEIVTALFDGFNRQNKAYGYIRAFSGMLKVLPSGLSALETELPYDLVAEIRKSKFYEFSLQSQEEFEASMIDRLKQFVATF